MKSTKTICLRLVLLWEISFVLLLSTTAFAQTAKVSGTVINQRTAAPIRGATIAVKNTSRLAIADEQGRFTIEASRGNVLVITMVGFQRTEIVVGNNNDIGVKLLETYVQLDDVVVIGYGQTKRKDVTGAISSVTGEELRKTQPVTFDQALQGKVPGLVVQQISGQPGGAVSLQIRGLSSFGASAPLYVIDGIIIGGTATLGTGTNPLAGINPSEIESIDVLKDASATAIYGSQATNGVIIITTKRGRAAAPSVSYEVYAGIQQLPKRLPVMNLQEYATFINARNTGLGWGFDTRPALANPKYLGEGTNWQKELFRNAPMSNHTLTISGGDARTQYLLSGSYFKQEVGHQAIYLSSQTRMLLNVTPITAVALRFIPWSPDAARVSVSSTPAQARHRHLQSVPSAIPPDFVDRPTLSRFRQQVLAPARSRLPVR